jgi:hypothetical protein
MTIKVESKGEAHTRRKLRLLKQQIRDMNSVVHTVKDELEVTTSILMHECYNLSMQLHALRDILQDTPRTARTHRDVEDTPRTPRTPGDRRLRSTGPRRRSGRRNELKSRLESVSRAPAQ